VKIVFFGLEYAVFQGYVDCCVLDVFVSEESLDMEYVVCFMVFHCGFPMSEGVESDGF